MTTLTLGEMVDALSPTYRGIDLRIAIARPTQQATWRLVFGCLRFSRELPDNIAIRHDELRSKYRNVLTPVFRIHLFSMPMLSLQNALGKTERQLQFLDSQVTLPSAASLETARCYMNDPLLRKLEPWPAFASYDQSADVEIPAGLELLSTIEGLVRLDTGFRDGFDAIRSCMDCTFSPGTSIRFAVSGMIYARIEKLDINREVIHCSVRFHSGFPGTMLNLIHRSGGSDQTLGNELAPLEGGVQSQTEQGMLTYEHLWRPRSCSAADIVEARLLHKKFPDEVLDFRRLGILGALSGENLLDRSFHETLSQFCSVEEYASEMLTPKKRGKFSPEKTFERSVAWLLSLFGYSPIALDEHEKLKAIGSQVEMDSVDILAADWQREQVLLVGCTIGTLSREDVDRLIATADTLKHYVPELKTRMVSVYVTQKSNPLIKEDGRRLGIRVLDLEDLNDVMDNLNASDLQAAKRIFVGRLE